MTQKHVVMLGKNNFYAKLHSRISHLCDLCVAIMLI